MFRNSPFLFTIPDPGANQSVACFYHSPLFCVVSMVKDKQQLQEKGEKAAVTLYLPFTHIVHSFIGVCLQHSRQFCESGTEVCQLGKNLMWDDRREWWRRGD